MTKDFQHKNYWALILGGSSGLGLATAKKLAKHGMNICIIHRNSRTQEDTINAEFDIIKAEGILFKSYNLDAFKPEKREQVISELKELFTSEGNIRTLVHSVAKGNLKPMISAEKSTLKNDDFNITINAMAISLYDWTQAVFEAKLFRAFRLILKHTSGAFSLAGLAGLGLLSLCCFRYIFDNKKMACVSNVKNKHVELFVCF